MDDEMLKCNTDCVFFLASPLTCKKGMECEFRHSEIARLNPRECWYWLAGNCLNPACGFRHPPLDLHNEATPESTGPAHQSSSATVKKTNVPCHFYYSGFCSKGNSCSFSHGPDWFTPPTSRTLKDSSAFTRGSLTKNDAIMKKAIITSNPVERKPSLSRTFPKIAAQSQPASHDVKISVAKIKVAPVERSASLVLAGHTPVRSHIPTNQSLEEQILTEELKASPGFHDFTNGSNSENLYYEDNQEEYSPPYVQYEEEPNSPSLCYEFKEPSEYDPMNPHAEIFCEYGIYDSCNNSESACSLDNAGTLRDEFSGRVPEFLSSGGRDLQSMEREDGGCRNVVDLRDCLRGHRVIQDHSASCLLRRHNFSHSSGHRYTRLGRSAFSRRLDRRLTALVGKNSVGSFRDYRFSVDGARKYEALRYSRVQSFRKWKGKRQLHATKASRNSFSRGHRSHREESAAFARPKTLNQINEERMGTKLNVEGLAGCLRISSSVGFRGPKPLSELLKEKAG